MAKIFFYLILVFIIVCPVFPATAVARARPQIVPAPVLIAPDEKTASADLRPLITGLAKDQAMVEFFIDGAFAGATGLLEHKSGTANFAYRPEIDLSRGWHKIYAIARDFNGLASGRSRELSFNIELPMPAPTMIKTVVNNNATSARPFITGLAKNNSRIKVFIDNKLNGEFLVENHESGTANFAYKPFLALSRGSHQAYTLARDARGKTSIRSNVISFSVKSAAIGQAVGESRKSAVASIAEPPAKESLNSVQISADSGKALSAADNLPEQEADKGKNIFLDEAGLSEIDSEPDKNFSGLVNESRENQGKLKVSLILFILFLVGIVAWLLWVNRELIKERQAQSDDAEKDNPGEKDKLF